MAPNLKPNNPEKIVPIKGKVIIKKYMFIFFFVKLFFHFSLNFFEFLLIFLASNKVLKK